MALDRQFALILVCFPLLAFVIAGVAEARAGGSAGKTLLRIVPAIVGTAAFALLWNPNFIRLLTPVESDILGNAMTMLSAVIACSGVFISYSRRSSAMWMALGGLILAFVWMFNRVVY